MKDTKTLDQQWGALGGRTRARKLSAKRRQEIARKAALARWTKARTERQS